MSECERHSSSTIGQTNRSTQNVGKPKTGVTSGCTNRGSTSTVTPAATSSNQGRCSQDQIGKDASWVDVGSLSLTEVLQELFNFNDKPSKTKSDRGLRMHLTGVPAQPPRGLAIQLAPYEIYVRTLLAEGHGLPCWEPRPLEPEAQPQGVLPGDVGTYTAESGFRRSFNLFDDARVIHGISQRTKDSPQSEYRDLRGNLIRKPEILRKGHAFVHGSSVREPHPPGQVGTVFEFHRDSDGPAGAILVLASPADEEGTDDINGMGEYIRQHAEAIYKHAFNIRPIGELESLYIVTGCIKSDSWATAAYRQGMDATHGGTLLLVPTLEASGGDPPQYEWTRQGSSRARAGRSDRKNVKDQCLFLQGFKLAFSPGFRSQADPRRSGDSSLKPKLVQAQGTGGYRNRASLLHEGSRSNNRGNNTHGIRCTPFPARTQTVCHPSDVINARLLQQTDCDIAVCHDDSWRFFFRSCVSHQIAGEVVKLEGESESKDDSGHRVIGVQNGVAFLLPDNQAERIPSDAKSAPKALKSSSLPRLQSNDIVVLVMGIVGAGRSTFINNLLPDKHDARKMAVGDGLDPRTAMTQCVILESQELIEVLGVEKDYRLVMVDTPGLDIIGGSKLDPNGVRDDIVTWSKSRLPVGQKPRGCVIFMHDITSDGFPSQRDFTSVGDLFTLASNSPRLIIVTSKWANSEPGEAEARHKQLTERFRRAEVHRLSQPEDAWDIMKQLLPRIEGGLMLDLEGESGDSHRKKKREMLGKSLRSLVCIADPDAS